MRHAPLAALALIASMFLAGIPLAPVQEAEALITFPALPGISAKLTQVASGFSSPLYVTHAGDGSGRMFIVEQRGTVRYMVGGVLQPDSWLDIQSKVLCCGERGLLGLAFYPDFESSGRLIVSYTRTGDGASVLERLTVPTPGGKPPTSGTILLVQSQPFANHNGGGINFGPDGYLYFGLGDGGSGGDPQNNGQNKNTLLGKMLRIDVSGAGGYTIPPGNPFATGGGRPEIWNYGLRNPWRWSFDRATGDLWIGDVGQNLYEEIDYQPAGQGAGRNYGWRGWEGQHPYNPGQAVQELSDPMLTFPVIEYDHSQGCSVTGGYVYRGPVLQGLQGRYIYGDYCSGQVWVAYGVSFPALPVPLPFSPPLSFLPIPMLTTGFRISSFGEDEAGNLYVVNYSGAIHRFTDP